MNASIAIVADDLTGAGDCAAACYASGLATVVALGSASRAREARADAVAFDADTRHLSPAAAAQAIALAVREFGAGGPPRVMYHKIDSTLRGNFAAELAGARQALGAPLALVAPAFPGAGRTMRGGRVFLSGRPLEESEIWRGAGLAGAADLPARLQRDGGLRTEKIGLDSLRHGPEGLVAALAAHLAAGVEAVVCDAETDEDLRIIARGGAAAPRLLLVGSGGLMRHVPAAYGLARPGAAPSRPPAVERRGPLLFVVGSRSQVSRRQLRRLSAEARVQTFILPPATLRAGPDSPAWQEAARWLAGAPGAGGDLALALGPGEDIDLAESSALSRALAQLVRPAVGRLAGLLCTGGETARAVLAAAGAANLRLAGEVEPGIPLGTIEELGDLPVVTKSGAFGSPEALIRIRAALRRLSAAAGRP
ncbi:MAG TPA: four-carbon acid sugar kinase family protein [Opitutaceae bacterium]|nr:four-carbon acid sugar kinase family protein [Opitutaceae bacterium]